MSRGKVSGYILNAADAAIVLGMQARDDRDHDIAAWFGVNQGRVAEVKDGKFGHVPVAPISNLPPKGAPGVKGRRLHDAVVNALSKLNAGATSAAVSELQAALKTYDTDEL